MALRVQASGEAPVRQEEIVALPLDYYKLLGVSAVCSRDNLAKALEKCGRRRRRACCRPGLPVCQPLPPSPA